jgi:hypothetical protein
VVDSFSQTGCFLGRKDRVLNIFSLTKECFDCTVSRILCNKALNNWETVMIELRTINYAGAAVVVVVVVVGCVISIKVTG